MNVKRPFRKCSTFSALVVRALMQSTLMFFTVRAKRSFFVSRSMISTFVMQSENLPPLVTLVAFASLIRCRPDPRPTSAITSTRCGGADGSNAVLSPLIPLIGRTDIPDVGFQRIAARADAHFCEVAHGIFCFWETCKD